MSKVNSYEDRWFTGGLVGEVQVHAAAASNAAERVLRIVSR